MDLVAQQKQAIKSGFMSAQEIAHSRITVDNDSGEADT
jgi:hypothetical protein